MTVSNSQRRVRELVWPWDQPPQPGTARPLWQRVLIQMCVMGVIAGLFFVFGKRGMTYFIVGLAFLFLLLAVISPLTYGRKEDALRRFAIWVGSALTHLLLLPFYWICFVPARLLLRIRKIDPMARHFPASTDSCWQPHPPMPKAEAYKRQYS